MRTSRSGRRRGASEHAENAHLVTGGFVVVAGSGRHGFTSSAGRAGGAPRPLDASAALLRARHNLSLARLECFDLTRPYCY